MTAMKSSTAKKSPIRVIVVDDSALIRKVLSDILNSDPGIEVIATAGDPIVARKKIREMNPDVVTLDIEMPKLDGLSFLERIMRLRPMPVVMVSALTERGSDVALEALEMGAVDALPKPKIDIENGLVDNRDMFVSVIKEAAKVTVFKGRRKSEDIAGLNFSNRRVPSSGHVIAIGASTGGVFALHEILGRLPADTPPVLVVQHITGTMIEKFTQRLNDNSRLNIVVAADGMRLMRGHAYVAPYDCHLKLGKSGGHFVARLVDEPPMSGHRPAVDALFSSIAAVARSAGTGVLLTGMGRDGANGMLEMRNAGATTVCQDEATSLIYGMPRAAVAIGAAQVELPLGDIAEFILRATSHDRAEEIA